MSTTLSDVDAPTRPHVPIDPRILERLLSVRRAEGRRRLRILIALAAAVAVAAAALGLVESPLAKVRHVRLLGPASVLSMRAQLLAVAGLGSGSHRMVDVHSSAVAARLDGLAPVATASVQRQWPSTVRISVTTRVPVALVLYGSEVAVADRTGRVLSSGAAQGGGLPVISLATPIPPVAAWLAGSAGPGEAALEGTDPASAAFNVQQGSGVSAELELASALHTVMGGQATSISEVTGVGLEATVEGATVIFGDTSQLLAKVAAFDAIASSKPAGELGTIDVRVPDRPVGIGG